MAQAGTYYRLEPLSGRFYYCGDMGQSSPGDQMVCVTGSVSDIHAAAAQLNTAAAIPMPITGRWQVTAGALASATPGARVQLTATTA